MKTVGIIAEFNPFHNGHQYIIEKAKQITGAEHVVIICSGNYVQRGYPAIIDKHLRARMAVNNGADAVFELPVMYATASAEVFARASVSFFDQLKCIDYLCFGCETDDMKEFIQIVNILFDEPKEYKELLNIELKKGNSFPKARMNALSEYCMIKQLLDKYTIESVLSNPNNILAIEYMKAIKHFKSKMKPVAIKRIGEHYHSLEMFKEFASATAIRNEIEKNNYKDIKEHVPENCFDTLISADKLKLDDFDIILGERLTLYEDFTHIYGINEGLSNRIVKMKNNYMGYESFIKTLQSKNYTYTAISRALLHLCLNIIEVDVHEFIDGGYHGYGRLLAFRGNSSILSELKSKSKITIISKLSTYYKRCSEKNKKMLDITLRADELYRMLLMNRFGKYIPTEFETQIYVK